jgi:phosphatidate cytidylyltransferase
MTKRILSGLFMALIVSLFIIFLPPTLLKVVVSLLVLLASNELVKILFPQNLRSISFFVLSLSCIYSLLVMFFYQSSFFFVLSLPILLMITLSYFVFLSIPVGTAFNYISKVFFSLFYPALFLCFLGLLRDLPKGTFWLFSVLASTFGADTGAYIFGKNFGKHKLAPRVSPGKTIEGLFGGMIFSVAVLFSCNFFIFHFLNAQTCLILGILIGLVGPLGDLSESLLKRGAGIKDSGNLIPGHGGILDRVDALIFTSPVVYYYAVLMK